MSRLSHKIYAAVRNQCSYNITNVTDTKHTLACTIVKNGRIITTGRNFRSFGTSHTCCCHAEMDAIYRHLKLTKKWEMFHGMLKKAYQVTDGPLTRISRRAS